MTSRKPEFRKIRKITQFIVGASDETDAEVVRYTAGLYSRLKLNRVYFSAYQRGLGDKSIPGESRVTRAGEDNFLREHRLYQTDFLLRSYGFKVDDFIFDKQGNLALDKDPKLVWALGHPEFFPVNVNRAGLMELVRVPGIGPLTARRIVDLRRETKFGNIDALPFKGRRLQMAREFISL